ncbi:hypothetical protein FRB94_008973 [Tulasnella sp. JGI-2019a]|nr:hypothetical protein FRB93_003496 [Tulasnella sp. JGI-2019a]KAG9014815.1 hypothetical protein FRB94_008973 [Tulasnella sp. JGI-2019a]KAG9040023.1 hypothetical protein FRB95_004495 [Tulasnella sp. JGI-2019a]
MSEPTAERLKVIALFEGFREEIDQYVDRRERIIKISREITLLSKRIIFSLHRLLVDHSAVTSEDARTTALRKTDPQFAAVRAQFALIHGELEGEALYWRFAKSISGGIQEYIEALSLAYYLEHCTLIPFSKVKESLKSEDGTLFVPLTAENYVLGVSDLTGELMRLVITSIGTQGTTLKQVQDVGAFVRSCSADFDGIIPYVRELRDKQKTTNQSLQKIESAAYGLSVRGAEYARFIDLRGTGNSYERAHEDEE